MVGDLLTDRYFAVAFAVVNRWNRLFAEKLMSVLEKLKALDEQRAKLLEDAKKEALEAAHKAIADLNELGFDYRLVEGRTLTAKKPPKERSEGEAPRRQARDVPCPICEFKTKPHHDGRAHRSQQEPKRPFTEEELVEKGLTKVA